MRVPHDDGAGPKNGQKGRKPSTSATPVDGARVLPEIVLPGKNQPPEPARDLVTGARQGGEAEPPNLRPQRFSEYIGQAALKRKLEVFVRAARGRGEPLDHTLLHGPPGLGKTTMAHILAHELGVKLHLTSGPAIEHKGVLAGHLTALGARDVLFIDEIHRLSPTVEESLYSAMEDRRIDLPVGEGTRARTIGFELAPFTLLGATTRTALLCATASRSSRASSSTATTSWPRSCCAPPVCWALRSPPRRRWRSVVAAGAPRASPTD
jgi:Holliday junction DNA helicase RuvB